MRIKIKKTHPLQWIAETLEDHPTFFQKKMFGCEMLSLHGRQMLVLAAQGEPWNGLLVCTSREHHTSLIKSIPRLRSHAVLGKWLYISQSDENFESVVDKIVNLVLENDPRIGIDPKPKKIKKHK